MEDKKYAVFSHVWHDPWEGKEISREYRLARPGRDDVNRFNKEVQKSPATAQQNLVMGLIHPEDKSGCLADLEQYPGLLVTLASGVLKASGLSGDLGN